MRRLSTLVLFILSLFSEFSLAQDLTLDISPTVPNDFNLDKSNHPIDVPLTDKNVAVYAWNTFFALNYPSFPIDVNHRGTPDPSKQFGDPGPTVWNTFKQKRELYRIIANPVTRNDYVYVSPSGYSYDSKDPGPFDSLIQFDQMSPGISPCAGVEPESPNTVWNFMDESQEISLATLWIQDDRPTNENLVRTQVKMNRAHFDYVRGHRYYDTNYLNSAIQFFIAPGENMFGPVRFPEGNEQNEGSILVKSSWVMNSKLPVPIQDKYYTVKAIYYDDSPNGGVCYRVGQFSLVGIHIIHKTKSFPQYLYTTFGNIHNSQATFVYANALGTASTLPNAFGYTYENPPNPQPGLQKPPYLAHYDLNPPRRIVTEVNNGALYAMAIKYPTPVWTNYQLVGLQFAAANGPEDPVNQAQDYYLANPVIETNQRLQKFTGTFFNSDSVNVRPRPLGETSTVQMGGCMGCHGAGAQGAPFTTQQILQGKGGTDFSFTLLAVRSDPENQGVETLLNPALNQITTGSSRHHGFVNDPKSPKNLTFLEKLWGNRFWR